MSRQKLTGRRYTRCFLLICCAAFPAGCTTLPRENQPLAQPPLAPQTSAQTPDTTIVAIAPPAAPAKPAPNLLDFLGINQIHDKVFGGLGYLFRQTQNRLGKYFPGLEPKPPIKSITDPANLSEDAPPAVSAAAKIKAEEDAAEQKIKGLKYLATIGCGGCYPDVEEALLAALDDCTEAVRYEAVKALRGPNRGPCKYCNSGSCCSAAVQKKLREVAYELNSSMCHIEPSERVRRLARLALRNCGPAIPSSSEELPAEGPSSATTAQDDSRDTTPGRVSPASHAQTMQVESGAVSSAVEFASTFTSLRDVDLATSLSKSPGNRKTWEISLEHLAAEEEPGGTNASDESYSYTWERYTLNPDKFRTLEEARTALKYVHACITGSKAEAEPAELSAEQLQLTTVRNSTFGEALSPGISEALEKLSPGEVSRPIGDEYGWHLIRLVDQFPAGARTH